MGNNFFKKIGLAAAITAFVTPVFGATLANGALPTGGQVVAGSATIAQNGNTLNVNQASQRAVINWNSFNVGSGATVNFNQPNSNSATLNRVVSAGKSIINGAINAPGQVVIVNSSGVVIGKGGEINAGAVIATTMNISDKDFMDGKSSYAGGNTGKVINKGKINITNADGYIALMAPEVKNEGVLLASMSGKNAIALASGQAVTLNIQGNQLISINVDGSVLKSLIENKRLIQTNGGQILLAANSASELVASVIKNTGIIDATGIDKSGGKVVLTASEVVQSGVIKADAVTTTDSGGATKVTGGNINLVGNNITLGANSKTTATGTNGGGSIIIGATVNSISHNAKPVADQSNPVAQVVTVEKGALIDASATIAGTGGKIIAWATKFLNISGNFKATGGVQSGDGGFIETSAYEVVRFGSGLSVNASAGNSKGASGHWLVDPVALTVDASGAAIITSALNSGSNVTLDITGNLSGFGSTISSGVGMINFIRGADIVSTNTLSKFTVLAANGIINIDNTIVAGGIYMSAAEINVGATGRIASNAGTNGSITLLAKLINLLGMVNSNGQVLNGISSVSNAGVNRRRTGLSDVLGYDGLSYAGSGGNVYLLASGDINIGSPANNTALVSANGSSGGSITISSSGGNINVFGIVDAIGQSGQGGNIQIAGAVTTLNSALISVEGQSFGGNIKIGTANNLGSGSTLAPPIFATLIPTVLGQNNVVSDRLSINNGALIQANGNNGPGGNITLDSNQDLAIINSQIQANGLHGGNIISSAGINSTLQSALIQTNGSNGRGGTFVQTGINLFLDGQTQIEATGTYGGGNILIGGDWQGGNDIFQATTTSVYQNVTLNASATNNGNGGKIVVWSNISNPNSITNVAGILITEGGISGGNGGKIETSGHLLEIAGIRVFTKSPLGAPGLWFLDPYDYVIDANAATAISAALVSANVTISTTAPSLTANSVTISGNAGLGSITVNAAISWPVTTVFPPVTTTLTLDASGSSLGATITINAPISVGDGNLTIYTGNSNALLINADVTTAMRGATNYLYANSLYQTLKIAESSSATASASVSTHPNITIASGATVSGFFVDIYANNLTINGNLTTGTGGTPTTGNLISRDGTTYIGNVYNRFVVANDFLIGASGALKDQLIRSQSAYKDSGVPDYIISVGRDFKAYGVINFAGGNYPGTRWPFMSQLLLTAGRDISIGDATTKALSATFGWVNFNAGGNITLNAISNESVRTELPTVINGITKSSGVLFQGGLNFDGWSNGYGWTYSRVGAVALTAGANAKIYLSDNIIGGLGITFNNVVELLNNVTILSPAQTYSRDILIGSHSLKLAIPKINGVVTAAENLTLQGDITGAGNVYFQLPILAEDASVREGANQSTYVSPTIYLMGGANQKIEVGGITSFYDIQAFDLSNNAPAAVNISANKVYWAVKNSSNTNVSLTGVSPELMFGFTSDFARSNIQELPLAYGYTNNSTPSYDNFIGNVTVASNFSATSTSNDAIVKFTRATTFSGANTVLLKTYNNTLSGKIQVLDNVTFTGSSSATLNTPLVELGDGTTTPTLRFNSVTNLSATNAVLDKIGHLAFDTITNTDTAFHVSPNFDGYVDVYAGTLKFGVANAFGTALVTAKNKSVGVGGTVDFNGFTVTSRGVYVEQSGGLQNADSLSTVYLPTVTLLTTSLAINSTTDDYVVNGLVLANGSSTALTGDGVFNKSQNFSGLGGALTIGSGVTMKLGSVVGSSATGSGVLAVASGSALDLNGLSLPINLSLAGAGISNSGALYSSTGSGNIALPNVITLAANSTINVGSGIAIVHNNTFNTGSASYILTKSGAGSLAIANNSTSFYPRELVVSAGIVTYNGGGLDAIGTKLSVANGAAFDLNTYSASLMTAYLSGTGISNGGAFIASGSAAIIKEINLTANATVAVNGDGRLVVKVPYYAENTTQGYSSGKTLTKVGAGTLILQDDVYSGGSYAYSLAKGVNLIVAGGVMVLENSATQGTGGTITYNIPNSISVLSGATLDLSSYKLTSYGNAGLSTLPFNIAGSGVAVGGQSLGAVYSSGSGYTTALTSTGLWTLTDNATINLERPFTINAKITGAYTLKKAGSNVLTLDTSSNTSDANSVWVAAGSVIQKTNNSIAGYIAGAGGLAADATLDVYGNTVNKPITLNAGTLTSSQNSGVISGTVTLSGNNVIYTTNNLDITGKITGTGGFTKTGGVSGSTYRTTSILTLSNGNNDFTGGLTLSSGAIKVNASGTTLGVGTVTVANGSLIDLFGKNLTSLGLITIAGAGTSDYMWNTEYYGALLNSVSGAVITIANPVTLNDNATIRNAGGTNSSMTITGQFQTNGKALTIDTIEANSTNINLTNTTNILGNLIFKIGGGVYNTTGSNLTISQTGMRYGNYTNAIEINQTGQAYGVTLSNSISNTQDFRRRAGDLRIFSEGAITLMSSQGSAQGGGFNNITLYANGNITASNIALYAATSINLVSQVGNITYGSFENTSANNYVIATAPGNVIRTTDPTNNYYVGYNTGSTTLANYLGKISTANATSGWFVNSSPDQTKPTYGTAFIYSDPVSIVLRPYVIGYSGSQSITAAYNTTGTSVYYASSRGLIYYDYDLSATSGLDSLTGKTLTLTGTPVLAMTNSSNATQTLSTTTIQLITKNHASPGLSKTVYLVPQDLNVDSYTVSLALGSIPTSISNIPVTASGSVAYSVTPYQLTAEALSNAGITYAVSGSNAIVSKAYDGSASVLPNGLAALNTASALESLTGIPAAKFAGLSVQLLSGSYSSTNVHTGQPLTLNYVLSGSNASNFTLSTISSIFADSGALLTVPSTPTSINGSTNIWLLSQTGNLGQSSACVGCYLVQRTTVYQNSSSISYGTSELAYLNGVPQSFVRNISNTQVGVYSGGSWYQILSLNGNQPVLAQNSTTLNSLLLSIPGMLTTTVPVLTSHTLLGTISPAALTVTGAANSAIYDGNVHTNSGATYSGQIGSDAFTISGYATGTNAGTFTDSLQLTATRGLLSNYNVTYINRALTIINPNTNSSAGNQSNVSSSNSSVGNQSNVSSGNSSLIYGPTVFPFRNLSVRNQAILDTIASRVSSVVAIPDSKTSMSSVIAGAPLKTQLTASSSAPLTGEAGSAVVMLAPVNNLKDAGLEVDTIKLTSLTNGKGDVPSKAVQELQNNANLNGVDVANNKRVEVNAVTKTNQSLPEGLGFDAKSTSFKSSNPDPKNFPLEVKLQLKVDGKVVSEKVMTLLK